MIKLDKNIGEQLSAKYDSFGYVCPEGCVIGDKEFIIWVEENGEYYLVHKSELIQEGCFFKLKKGIKNY